MPESLLRDLFAAIALHALGTGDKKFMHNSPDIKAAICYAIADAMIAERNENV